MPTHNQFYRDPAGNPAPVLLAAAGPVLQVELHVPQALATILVAQGQPVPPPETGWALIDTGASRTAVNDATVKTLGVSPVGKVQGGTAGGQVVHDLYPVRFVFPGVGGVGWDIQFSASAGVDLTGQIVHGQQIVALLGRDVLGACVLTYNGVGGLYTLSW